MSEPEQTVEQAADEPQSVTFKGQQFTLNPDVSEFAFFEFAEAASEGQDAASLQGMASLLRFVVELIGEDDRDRFRALCRRERVSSEDLVALLLGKAEDDAERPTVRSSDSTDGPPSTEPNSDANSVDSTFPTVGVDLLEGRPDLKLMVAQAAKAS